MLRFLDTELTSSLFDFNFDKCNIIPRRNDLQTNRESIKSRKPKCYSILCLHILVYMCPKIKKKRHFTIREIGFSRFYANINFSRFIYFM